MIRNVIILLLWAFATSAQVTINNGPATVTVNKPGRPAMSINRVAPVIPINYKSYSFDGIDDYGVIPQSTLNFVATDPQSYEMWFKTGTVGGAEKVLFSTYNSATRKGTKISINSNEYIELTIRNDAARIFLRTQFSKVYNGATVATQRMIPYHWYHLVISYDGTNASGVNIYVDGYLVGKTVQTNNLSGDPGNDANVYFGRDRYGNGDADFELGLFRAFSKALSAGEADTLYNKGSPLLSTDITGKVFEVLPGDTFKDNANDVTGLLSGATLKDADVNMNIRTGNQYMTGDSMYYLTFGDAGEGDTLTISDSPFTDQRTCIFYDAATNRTYIGWQQRPYLGGNRQSMIMTFDHSTKVASPSYPVGYESPGGIDNHGAPSVTMYNGIPLLVHEDQHQTPLYVRRPVTGSAISGEWELISTISGTYAYPAWARLGDTLYLMNRIDYPFQKDQLSKSTDGGVTWSAPLIVLDLNNGGGIDRAYFRVIHDPNKLRYLIRRRDEVAGIYTGMYYIESNDGYTFRNVNNTFSKNVVSSGNLTRAEMDANFLVYNTDTTDMLLKTAFPVGSSGLVGYINDVENNYRFFYWSGSAWVTKPLPLPIYYPPGAMGHAGRIDMWATWAYDLDHHVIFRPETRGGYDVIVRYETFDRWDTWDEGTIISAPDRDHQQMQYTYNVTGLPKMIITANALKGENFDNDIFLYEFIP